MNRKPRLLFITRRYPPSIGGIETHCYQLNKNLAKLCSVRLIALSKKSKIHLLWFLPQSFLYAFEGILFKRYDTIYFADGVVGFYAPFLRFFTQMRFCTTIYGLEMAVKNPVTRWLMSRGANASDEVIVISKKTKEITERTGIPSNKIKIIYVGIHPPEITDQRCQKLKNAFEREHNISFHKDKIILNFGRMVPRKGVVEFLKKGMPLLDKDIKLIIGGNGPDFNNILTICKEYNYENRVILLQRPSDEIIAMLRKNTDLFILPNVSTRGDVEGYGMTQLESMYTGTPVVAFAVDALVESVREGGYLIDPNDYISFINAIHAYFKLSDKKRDEKRKEAMNYVRREYSWEKTAQQYYNVFFSSG
ncbi:MAG: glycosyltransferase family 4 protein [Chitinispirillia bacterium]|jgi:phosphatidylinositol alpha-1,6-mannosyltransferase